MTLRTLIGSTNDLWRKNIPQIKVSLYPILTGAKAPDSKDALRSMCGRSSASKNPIGSTNDLWRKNIPQIKVSLY